AERFPCSSIGAAETDNPIVRRRTVRKRSCMTKHVTRPAFLCSLFCCFDKIDGRRRAGHCQRRLLLLRIQPRRHFCHHCLDILPKAQYLGSRLMRQISTSLGSENVSEQVQRLTDGRQIRSAILCALNQPLEPRLDRRTELDNWMGFCEFGLSSK